MRNLISTVNPSLTMNSEAAPFNHTTGRPCGDGFFEPRTEIFFSKCHGKEPAYYVRGYAFWNRVARAGSKGVDRLVIHAKNKTGMANAFNCPATTEYHRSQFERAERHAPASAIPVYEAPSFSNPDANHWCGSAAEGELKCVGFVFPWDGRMNADGDLMPARTATPRSKWVLVKF
jgi:hypothetical protein